MLDNFVDFNLDKDIIKALEILEYKKPLNVQKQVIPKLLKKKNLVVKSKTGSGKSASFAIPICQNIKSLDNKIRALVISPTRELALQLKNEIESIGRIKKIKCTLITGKEPLKEQIYELKCGVNVVIATPGRLIDHITKKTIDLSHLEYLIIDEVDKMFTKGFISDMKIILDNVKEDISKSFFSATINDNLLEICNKYMEDYEYVDILDFNDKDNLNNKSNIDIIQKQVRVLDEKLLQDEEDPKYIALKYLIYDIKPSMSIIFTNTKRQAKSLFKKMKSEGFLVEEIDGDINQEKRFYTMEDFKKLKFNILISSDVISRGIHIDDISLVVNYDVPQDTENYVHRIGRTGRVGKKGIAVTLVMPYESKIFENIERYIGQSVDKFNIDYDDKNKLEYEEVIHKLKNNKNSMKKNQGEDSNYNKEITKIHLDIGKNKKIRNIDIVGALSNIEEINYEDIGIIMIYSNYSTVDILNKKGDKFLANNEKIIIKKKTAKVRRA